MPTNRTESEKDTSNPAQRTTFRPPWVKDGPNPLPVPAQPWELKKTPRKDSNASDNSASDAPMGVTLKKVSVQTKEPQENGAVKDVSFEKPKLKPVPPKEINIPKKNKIPLPKLNSISDATAENPLAGVQLRKTSIKSKEPAQENGTKEPEFIKPKLKPVPVRETTPPKKEHKLQLPKLNSVADRKLPDRKPSLHRMPTNDDDLDKEVPATRNALVRAESMRRMSQQGPAPPPMPPPPPLMPGEKEKKELSKKQKERIEQLKSRPKVRPDWSSMLKEIEGNKKLKHVVCNDRSQPLLPEAKATDHFVFESEKDNCHNELLKEIQFGVKLKKVKTNDRSRPVLEGLRKFRRQMTIEEQIQKSMSMASIPPEEIPVDEVDEMDDIDKVRDDLQSTKQMMALEMRNKEAQIRENKMLLARIQNLEAELEKERNKKAEGGGAGAAVAAGGGGGADEKVIKSLKTEAEQARTHSTELEKKYKESAEQLDSTKSQLEEIRRQNRELEKKLQEAMSGKRLSISDRKNSMANGDNSDLDFFSSDDEEESDGEETEEKKEKKALKELKHLKNKLRNFKNKEDNAKKERVALREIIKRNQTAIKAEKKKFKQLQKEVNKMAAMLKECDEEEEEEDDEEKPVEEEEEEESSEESSEEESESESDDSDSERSQSEPEDAPMEKKKTNLESRNNRHESLLSALKKGNFMLKTNAERLQDELNKQKDATESLKLDLDSVLSELG